MPPDSSEKIKFWILIGLALVAAVVAYFRFWHQNGAAEPDRLAAAPAQTQPAATPTAIDRQPGERAHQRPPDAAVPTVNRDIFRPVKMPPAAAGRPRKTKAAKSAPIPVPNLKLGGTIVSGKESIAIINDRFLRTGDTIAAFKIVRIEKNKVQLVSGTKHIELKMISNE